jgi:hypothetical protein
MDGVAYCVVQPLESGSYLIYYEGGVESAAALALCQGSVCGTGATPEAAMNDAMRQCAEANGGDPDGNAVRFIRQQVAKVEKRSRERAVARLLQAKNGVV